MSTVDILRLILLIIAFGAISVGFYKLLLEAKTKKHKHKHKYLTPAGLSGNTKWATLIEDWRSLSKLDSWTPEHSRAEEAYRLKFRAFLQTDLDKLNILDVPIVALTLQCTEIYIERYHTRTGDLDFSKALDDRTYITHVIHKGNIPKEMVSTIRKIRDTEDFVDDKGVDAAMSEFIKVKKEIQGLSSATSVSENAEIDNQLPKQPPESISSE